jgi:hypothetical protein
MNDAKIQTSRLFFFFFLFFSLCNISQNLPLAKGAMKQDGGRGELLPKLQIELTLLLLLLCTLSGSQKFTFD